MTDDEDIIATAPKTAPEILPDTDLDAVNAAAYGGSNSCEPYAGDNTCEQPSAGHTSFQELTVTPPRHKDGYKAVPTRNFSAK